MGRDHGQRRRRTKCNDGAICLIRSLPNDTTRRSSPPNFVSVNVELTTPSLVTVTTPASMLFVTVGEPAMSCCHWTVIAGLLLNAAVKETVPPSPAEAVAGDVLEIN